MEALRTGVFVLLLLNAPCAEGFAFSDPFVCYCLDGILIFYCIVATALFFREKFSYTPPVVEVIPMTNGGVYQELERPREADPYQVLEPTRRKKKAAKKKRSELTQAEDRSRDPNEPLPPSPPAPH